LEDPGHHKIQSPIQSPESTSGGAAAGQEVQAPRERGAERC